MDIKFFEIRDRGTTIAAMGVDVSAPMLQPALERAMLEHAGFGPHITILLIHLEKPQCSSDPHEWGANSSRTMPLAHKYILENWYQLKSGALIDVEFLLGESTKAKEPEIK